MYCKKCGKQIEGTWKGCPYCGNSFLDAGQETKLKREEDRKYNRKMTIWLIVTWVSIIRISVWINSIWYQLYFWGLFDFAKNNLGGIVLTVIWCVVLGYIAKDHISLKYSSEEQAEKWILVYRIMDWISKICYAIIIILIIRAVYEVIIVNKLDFQLHIILANAQGIILWNAISSMADSLKCYIYGGDDDDKAGIE